MKIKSSINLAIDAIHHVMKGIAFDANVALKDQNAPPMMKKRLQLYQDYTEAIKILEKIRDEN